MDNLLAAFSLRRWRRRFRNERDVVADARAAGRAPDATVDEVGVPIEGIGFDGRPIASPVGNGQGSGDVAGPHWAGRAGSQHGGGS